jgi:hypothetical protein
MDQYDLTRLPVHGQQEGALPDEEEAACSPKIYVSNEEASLLAALRKLRDRAVTIRRRLSSDAECDRDALASELERLRAERDVLERRRELAYTRKMVMLGHLPPSVLKD